jgi:hypothetical protein
MSFDYPINLHSPTQWQPNHPSSKPSISEQHTKIKTSAQAAGALALPLITQALPLIAQGGKTPQFAPIEQIPLMVPAPAAIQPTISMLDTLVPTNGSPENTDPFESINSDPLKLLDMTAQVEQMDHFAQTMGMVEPYEFKQTAALTSKAASPKEAQKWPTAPLLHFMAVPQESSRKPNIVNSTCVQNSHDEPDNKKLSKPNQPEQLTSEVISSDEPPKPRASIPLPSITVPQEPSEIPIIVDSTCVQNSHDEMDNKKLSELKPVEPSTPEVASPSQIQQSPSNSLQHPMVLSQEPSEKQTVIDPNRPQNSSEDGNKQKPVEQTGRVARAMGKAAAMVGTGGSGVHYLLTNNLLPGAHGIKEQGIAKIQQISQGIGTNFPSLLQGIKKIEEACTIGKVLQTAQNLYQMASSIRSSELIGAAAVFYGLYRWNRRSSSRTNPAGGNNQGPPVHVNITVNMPANSGYQQINETPKPTTT